MAKRRNDINRSLLCVISGFRRDVEICALLGYCPETSVRNYQYTLRNISEEGRSLYLISIFSEVILLDQAKLIKYKVVRVKC